jgi:hypothetical protein
MAAKHVSVGKIVYMLRKETQMIDTLFLNRYNRPPFIGYLHLALVEELVSSGDPES